MPWLWWRGNRDAMATTRVGLLHLEPKLGEIGHNRRLIERGLALAVSEGVQWVLTPELCVSGYDFRKIAGTDWIHSQPDSWMSSIQSLVRDAGLTLFLSHPQRDSEMGTLYNSLFVIGPGGDILGVYHKIKVTGGAESWSAPGEGTLVVDCGGIKVGMLICADAWFPELVMELKSKGAEVLVSPAAWPPELHGPEFCWEQRSAETGLPLFVCNRAGAEEGINLNYRRAESVVAHGGRRLLTECFEESTLVCFDWDFEAASMGAYFFRPII